MGVRVFVIHRPITRNEVSFPLEPKLTGAILEYFHVVREEQGGELVRGMRFEADRELLQARLLQLAHRVTKDYDLMDLECFRRVGEVASGEPCLLLRIAATHFSEAHRALSDFLEELRTIDITSAPLLK